MNDVDELRERYAAMSTEELLRRLLSELDQYAEPARTIVELEAKKRVGDLKAMLKHELAKTGKLEARIVNIRRMILSGGILGRRGPLKAQLFLTDRGVGLIGQDDDTQNHVRLTRSFQLLTGWLQSRPGQSAVTSSRGGTPALPLALQARIFPFVFFCPLDGLESLAVQGNELIVRCENGELARVTLSSGEIEVVRKWAETHGKRPSVEDPPTLWELIRQWLWR